MWVQRGNCLKKKIPKNLNKGFHTDFSVSLSPFCSVSEPFFELGCDRLQVYNERAHFDFFKGETAIRSPTK